MHRRSSGVAYRGRSKKTNHSQTTGRVRIKKKIIIHKQAMAMKPEQMGGICVLQ